MRKFLQKYWLLIAFVLFLAFTEFYLMPRQEKSYFPWEIERFSKATNHALLILEAILLVIFLLYFIKKERSVRPVLLAVIVTAVYLSAAYVALKDGLAATGLYVNQWSTREVVSKPYIAEFINNEHSDIYFSLIEVGSKNRLTKGDLRKAVYGAGVANGDTVYAEIKKGILNAVYFDGSWTRKK